MIKQQCASCGSIGLSIEYILVRTTNGGLLLCRQCLDDINRKNPELANLRAQLAAREAECVQLASERNILSNRNQNYYDELIEWSDLTDCSCPAVAQKKIDNLLTERDRHVRRADYAVEACDQAREVMGKVADERDKLSAFKKWVHDYLDSQGVPVEFPNGPHTREGCRIGDRMDWWRDQRDTLTRERGELRAEINRVAPFLASHNYAGYSFGKATE